MSEGVEAGPLARLLLKRIDLNDNGISMDRVVTILPSRRKSPAKSQPSMVDTPSLTTLTRVSVTLPAENRVLAVTETFTANS